MQDRGGRVPPAPGSVPAGELEVHIQRVVPGVLHLRQVHASVGTSSFALMVLMLLLFADDVAVADAVADSDVADADVGLGVVGVSSLLESCRLLAQGLLSADSYGVCIANAPPGARLAVCAWTSDLPKGWQTICY